MSFLFRIQLCSNEKEISVDIHDALREYNNNGGLNDLILHQYRRLEENITSIEQYVKKEFSPIWNKRIFRRVREENQVRWTISSATVDLLIKKEKKFQYVITFSNEGTYPTVTFRWKGSAFSIINICGNKEQILYLLNLFCEQAKQSVLEIKT